MQCGTCREAKSEQLPVSEVCRQCHEFSKWYQSVPNYRWYGAVVTLYLCEYNGTRWVSNFPSTGNKVIAQKTMQVWFEVPE